MQPFNCDKKNNKLFPFVGLVLSDYFPYNNYFQIYHNFDQLRATMPPGKHHCTYKSACPNKGACWKISSLQVQIQD